MFHLTDAGPKPCSTTPDKCPIKNPEGTGAEHFETLGEAYNAYEKEMANKTFAKTQKQLTLNPESINEETWKKYGFKSLDFDPRAELSDHLSRRSTQESIVEISKLNHLERNALTFYTSSAFRKFQRVMFRRNEPDLENSEIYKETMENLDTAIDKAPLRDKILYRGMGGDNTLLAPSFDEIDIEKYLEEDFDDDNWFDTPAEDMFSYDVDEDKKINEYVKDNLGLGKVIEFQGYQSSTKSPAVAGEYANGGILFEIKTPEGLNIKSISDYDTEEEFLLPRESKYMVVGVQKDEYQFTRAKYIVQLIAVNDDNTIKTNRNKNKPRSTWDELLEKPLNTY